MSLFKLLFFFIFSSLFFANRKLFLFFIQTKSAITSIFHHFSQVVVPVFEETTSGSDVCREMYADADADAGAGASIGAGAGAKEATAGLTTADLLHCQKFCDNIGYACENRLSRSENWSGPKSPVLRIYKWNVYVIADVLWRVVPVHFLDGRRICFHLFSPSWKKSVYR